MTKIDADFVPCGGGKAQDFGHVADPILRRFLRYWLDKRGSRAMPARQDIDPTDVPWALSRIWLAEVLRDPLTVRYRLAGEDVRAIFDRRLTGLCLEDVFPASQVALVRASFSRVILGREIVHQSGTVYKQAGKVVDGERLMLPLSSDGETVDFVIGVSVYSYDRSSDGDTGGEPGWRETGTPIALRPPRGEPT
ncbi:MAG: PAS domain-containing protein [Rhodospirillaceae bacterium]|nr:PAS domain-containing protein [Rhodospirillaceae bacterium]